MPMMLMYWEKTYVTIQENAEALIVATKEI